MRPVLVTGATGTVGSEVVRALVARGVPVRAAARRPVAVARAQGGAGLDAVRFDLCAPETWSAALLGCRSLFLLRPPAIADVKRTFVPFVDAALAAGVRDIVFMSVAGAERNPLLPHHGIEEHLAGVAPGAMILRPGFFAQNLAGAYLRDIVDDDRLYVPAGGGRVAFVDARDVAEVAARWLCEPGAHRGRACTLTGPERLGFDTAAALLGAAVDRPIRYEAASIPGYVRHLRGRGMAGTQIAVQTLLHVGIRLGLTPDVDPTLGELLGRAPRTLATYVADHVSRWSPVAVRPPAVVATATTLRSGSAK